MWDFYLFFREEQNRESEWERNVWDLLLVLITQSGIVIFLYIKKKLNYLITKLTHFNNV